MAKLKYCLRSMRLRTLPLSLAGIAMGAFLAASQGPVSALTVSLLVLTTAALQVLSNLSNELGDSLSGTDAAGDRQGMRYSMMDGGLTAGDMKSLIAGAAAVSAVSGTLMIYSAFGSLFCLEAVAFILLGAAAIWAAMHYTLGSHPYGYRGLGDLFVFIFFGLATVAGGYFICSRSCDVLPAVLPACAIGLFSVGVLNVNNIRDMRTDAATRVTVAIRLGGKRARIYQTVLISGGFLCMSAFCLVFRPAATTWMFLLSLPLFALHLKGVWTRSEKDLDPMLPLLVMSSFAFALLSGIGMLF